MGYPYRLIYHVLVTGLSLLYQVSKGTDYSAFFFGLFISTTSRPA
jgi:hypothetical protein